jgi:hypothetical protein
MNRILWHIQYPIYTARHDTCARIWKAVYHIWETVSKMLNCLLRKDIVKLWHEICVVHDLKCCSSLWLALRTAVPRLKIQSISR